MKTNKHPIYIISKGRWESRITSKTLEQIGVDYKIVIEPQEYEQYAAVIDPKKILILPFSNLGVGSYPARNWVWEHSISIGAEKHWIMDDNIRGFYRFNDEKRIKVYTPTIFGVAEEFVERFTNVPIAGFNYRFSIFPHHGHKPFVKNSRIYSCILLDNSCPYRWRLKYNEDVDLCLQIYKAGLCGIEFNSFLSGKMATQALKGGNTDELYAGGTYEKTKMLYEYHPDVVKMTTRYQRDHHFVNWKVFMDTPLIYRDDYVPKYGVNDYGMVFRERRPSEPK